MDEIDSEIPKYRKKRIGKEHEKSNHKHEYKLVIFHRVSKLGKDFYFTGYVCSVCGKVGKTNFIETDENGYWVTDVRKSGKYNGLETLEYNENL